MISSPDAISWETQFGDLDKQERLGQFNMDEFKFAFSWSFEDCEQNLYHTMALVLTGALFRRVQLEDTH
jgi:hypothetical protein